MRRVLICGDLFWTNYARTLAFFRKEHARQPVDVVIEGECKGGDKLGRKAAEALGLSVGAGSIKPFPADWNKYKLGAGPIRNQQQLVEGKPTEVWAFHNHLETSTGTKDMVGRAQAAGLQVIVITDTEEKTLVNPQPQLFGD